MWQAWLSTSPLRVKIEPGSCVDHVFSKASLSENHEKKKKNHQPHKPYYDTYMSRYLGLFVLGVYVMKIWPVTATR